MRARAAALLWWAARPSKVGPIYVAARPFMAPNFDFRNWGSAAPTTLNPILSRLTSSRLIVAVLGLGFGFIGLIRAGPVLDI